MSRRREGNFAVQSTAMSLVRPIAKEKMDEAQIIGLLKNRLSGIVLSRHAYAKTLRTIFPSLKDTEVKEAKANPCKVNVWAARPLCHNSLNQFEKLDGLNVWCLVTESTELPFRTHEAADNSDQIWVPSTFVAKTVLDSGINPAKVFLIPYHIHHPTQRDRELIHSKQDREKFSVLVAWDGCSNLHRKGVLESIEAFKLALGGFADATLTLKTRDLRPVDLQEITDAAGDELLSGKIILNQNFVPTVDEIYYGHDILLHTHKAEGYGRCVIEAMLREVPVVATNYSGPLDWFDFDSGYPIQYDMEETSPNEFRYPQGGMWAKPRVDDIARVLRDLYVQKKSRGHCRGPITDRALLSAKDWSSEENSRQHMVDALKCGGIEVE